MPNILLFAPDFERSIKMQNLEGRYEDTWQTRYWLARIEIGIAKCVQKAMTLALSVQARSSWTLPIWKAEGPTASAKA